MLVLLHVQDWVRRFRLTHFCSSNLVSAVKHGIDTGAGVIDSDYRGHVRVLLFNHSTTDFASEYKPLLLDPKVLTRSRFAVKKGDRIAQMIIEVIITPEVQVVQTLDETVRGANGFGSTGGFGTSSQA